MTAIATIDEMLSTLTLEEKASLLAGSDHWLTQALPQHGIDALLYSGATSSVTRYLRARTHP